MIGIKNGCAYSIETSENEIIFCYEDDYSDLKDDICKIFQHFSRQVIRILLGKIAEAVIVRRFNIDYKEETIKSKYIDLFHWNNQGAYFRTPYYKLQGKVISIYKNIPSMIIFKANEEHSLSTMVARNGLFFWYDYLFKYFSSPDYYDVDEKNPIIYFGLNNDYEKLKSKLRNDYDEEYKTGLYISSLNQNFLNAETFDAKAYNEVCKYANLVMDFVDGKLDILGLLNHQDVNTNKTFKNAIISTFYTLKNEPNFIVADGYDDVLDENNN